LWESIPPRSQRRLRELCDDKRTTDYAAALVSARRSVRRFGLFAAGDLLVALKEVVADEGVPEEVLSQAGGLRRLAKVREAVADLLRLSTSPEYAHARWQVEKLGVRQGGGGFATL
ncbi:MAG TPA: hypothetical protein PKA88_31795, partial [Polyangiaceae bacterium]|nr:hypothetical protein [Polyangiaceae bacterium]